MRHPRTPGPVATPQRGRSSHRQTKRRVVVALNLAVLLVIGAGAAAYGTFGKTVTLDVDGHQDTVRTFGASVGSLLKAQDVDLSGDTAVNARPTEPVSDGDTITVRYAKDVSVAIDGEVRDETVHAATVGDVLDALDVTPAEGAEVSGHRDTRVDDGTQVVVSNPKPVTVVADGEKTEVTTAAPTAAEVLDEAGVSLGDSDQLDVAQDALVREGETLTVTRIELEDTTETVEDEPKVEYRDDADLEKGTEKVLQEGAPSKVEERVLLTKADGKVSHRLVLTTKTVEKGSPRVVARGTAEAPSVDDGSVWDRIAKCESGGNWSINTGNGYYGGLQFSAATWRSVGGPGLPHEHSREVQIKYAKILQERSGWGQWSCAAKVGVG